MSAPQKTPQKSMAELAAEYGLAPNEYQVVLDRLGREHRHQTSRASKSIRGSIHM